DLTLVTSGARDIASLRDIAAGFEFTNSEDALDVVLERSSQLTSPFFDPSAVSHQDFIADFTDSNTVVPGTTIRIPLHVPINISVHLESYAWDFPFADAFVLLNYTIKNTGRERLNDVYVSLWADMVVRNTNITPPRVGAPFYQNVGNGFSDSLRMAYSFDFNGDPGFVESGLYIGLKHLGATPQADDDEYIVRATYNAWLFRNSTDPVLFSPITDIDSYQKQREPMDAGVFNANIAGKPGNFMTLITTGPFKILDPDSSINVVFAVICASKFGNDPNDQDTEQSRQDLYTNAFWAQTAYDGEDRNGNNRLDPGEDLDRDGRIDRYILPTPPNSPRAKIISSDRKITIYWDRSAEESIDFISGKMDFEGYRIYRTKLAEDLPGRDLLSSLSLIAEFDSVNGIGFDTGFDFVRLEEPITFGETFTNPLTGLDETIFYYYKFENTDLLNGWQYAYGVTAFDGGDPEINLGSLESSRLANVIRVFPGSSTAEDQMQENPGVEMKVGVYPNPYRGTGAWDGNLERERKIYFFNLPANSEVRIYTLGGDLVDKFEHHGTYQGDDIQWFSRFSPIDPERETRVFSGGEHAWDLVTQDDQAVASGLYFFTVEDFQTGKVQRGKFIVIK
ncbi:hypothetical protein MJD09_28340, partial [bacterium]|nr:hypothetical protein [bacterium]